MWSASTLISSYPEERGGMLLLLARLSSSYEMTGVPFRESSGRKRGLDDGQGKAWHAGTGGTDVDLIERGHTLQLIQGPGQFTLTENVNRTGS